MDSDLLPAEISPAFAIYIGFLFAAGVLALAGFCLWFVTRKTEPFPGVSPWQIRLSDFLTFIFALLLCVIAVGLFVQAFVPRTEDATPEEAGPLLTILAGFLMQGGFVAIFFLFRAQLRTWRERSLNLAPKPLSQAAWLGLVAFFASWPVVAFSSGAWLYFITFLRDLGIDIQLAPQAPVEMFLEAERIFHLIALIALAVVVAPLAEEYVFRAGIFRYLRGHMPLLGAAAINGLLFGLIHFNIQSFLALAVLGALLCLAYEWTGDIKVPVFFHAIFNLNTVVMLHMQV